MSDLSFYEAVGLYDPEGDDAEEIRNLLCWLEDLGMSPELIESAASKQELTLLAADASMRPIPSLTFAEAAHELGLSVGELDRLRRTAGLAPRPMDRPAFTKAEIEAFRGIQHARDMFTETEASHFARVLGSSLARIADAAVSLFLIDIEGPLLAAGGTELDVARKNILATEAVGTVAAALDPLLRLHLDDAIRRSREARRPGDNVHLSRLAVGFVDLVGFTAYSEERSHEEVGELVREFEDTAYDLVADHGGRVVKLIGDEVMFVSTQVEHACQIATALIGAFRGDHVTPRGGLAYGELLTRGGDYYGPIVNLASRIADLAVPCELLATPDIADGSPSFAFEPAGRRMLKGFSEPVALVSLSC